MSAWVQAKRRLAAGQLRRSSRRPWPGPAGWLPGLAGSAGLAGLAVTGCAGQANAGLPPKARAPAAAVLTDPQLGARDQVLAAYAGYWQATGAAVNAGGPAAARELLARYLTPGAIAGVLAALRPDWAEHAVSTGSPVTHVLSVKITAGHALVHDCVDLSQAAWPMHEPAGPIRAASAAHTPISTLTWCVRGAAGWSAT